MLATLFKINLYQIKNWFTKDVTAKLTVTLSFLGVYFLVGFGLFALSSGFFYSLRGFEQYGLLTAEYILNTSIVILFFLAVGGCIAQTLHWFLTESQESDFLLTNPIKPEKLLIWQQLKAIINTSFLLSLFLIPIYLAYIRIFGLGLGFLFNLMLVIATLAIFSQTIGLLIAEATVSFFRQQGRVFTVSFVLIIFVILALVLIRVLFPLSLRTLYASQPADFETIYNNLPLNKVYYPSYWLVQSLTRTLNTATIVFLSLGLLLFLSIINLVKKKLLSIFQDTHSHQSHHRHQVYHSRPTQYYNPLITQSWLKFIRDNKELGYATFLLLLASFFFLLLSRSQFVRTFEAEWHNEIFIFTLGWMLFFSTAYCLRLVYPLMAKLRPESWYLITHPIDRQKLLSTQMYLGLLLCLPLALISLTVWSILPISLGEVYIGTGISLWAVLLLYLICSCLGAVRPDFEHANEPEVTSTTSIGLLALSLCLFVGLVFSLTAFAYLEYHLPFYGLTTILGTITFLILITLPPLARWSVEQYEF